MIKQYLVRYSAVAYFVESWVLAPLLACSLVPVHSWIIKKHQVKSPIHISARLCVFSVFVLCIVGFQTASAASDKLRVFTHGEGAFGTRLEDGRYVGPGVDLLRCSMQALQQPFVINLAAMVRKSRLASDGAMDAWFPSLVYGPASRQGRIAYPIGKMPLYWYVPKSYTIDPASDEFAKLARVSAFPGSTPESLLRAKGFQILTGTDDENIMVLRLAEGQLDGFLATSFESLLKPRTKVLLDARITRTLYKSFDAGIEFTESFVRKNPGFLSRFQIVLKDCANRYLDN